MVAGESNQCLGGEMLQSRSSHPKEAEKKFKGIWEGTTWLEPVPFVDMDKDEEKAIIRVIEEIKTDCAWYSKDSLDDLFNTIKLNGADAGEDSISVGPVLQVISISISNKSDGSLCKVVEIYGEISVTDDKNNIFYIYKCESDKPDRVTPHRNHLFLNGCTIPPVMGGKVKYSLTNKDGRKIFEGQRDVEESITEDEGKFTLELDGKDGYRASMVFNKIWFAGIVKVDDMYLSYTAHGQEGTYNVHGTIKVNDVVCFQTQIEEAVKMEHGKRNALCQSRYVFAVPVYTPLVVKIELFSGEHVVADDKEELCYPSDGSERRSYTVIIPCKDENYSFSMDVKWILHDDYFHGPLGGVREDDLNVKWSSNAGQLRFPLVVFTSNHLVEVFSICVAGGDSSAPPLALCGTIVVRDGGGTVYIFSRNKNLPDMLSPDDQKLRILSLAWPINRWVQVEDIYMHFKLKDDCDNRVCRGTVTWRPDIYTRYDIRMCDVILGEKGYFAAVHYSVFQNAKRAKVSVKWQGDYSFVYGCVIAQYSDHSYPSTYHKEYYRSIIFKRSEEEGVKVRNGSKIPLSKSHIAAPSDCKGIVVHVKLWYRPIKFPVAYPNENVKLWYGPILFEDTNTNASQLLGGCMYVKVKWVNNGVSSSPPP